MRPTGANSALDIRNQGYNSNFGRQYSEVEIQKPSSYITFDKQMSISPMDQSF